MSRRVGVGALGILLSTAGLVNAQDAGPPLTAPSTAARTTAEADASAPKIGSPGSAGDVESTPRRPLLVIPGVTAPASSSRATRKPEPRPSPSPPLAGPATAAPVAIPLTLEPIPSGEDVAEDPLDESPSTPKRRTDSPTPGPGRPESSRNASPAPAQAGGSRSFPGSVLGRVLGPRGGEPDDGGITVESRTDPAVEAAVKRRVEKEVREALGDRADSIEVRVTGRNVLIRAHASRFWRRWSVRRTLDALQMPSGYRGRAELID